MHRLVASLAAAGLSAGLVAAAPRLIWASAPAPFYTKAPIAVPYGWGGFYAGANAGWVGSTGNDIGLSGTDTGWVD